MLTARRRSHTPFRRFQRASLPGLRCRQCLPRSKCTSDSESCLNAVHQNLPSSSSVGATATDTPCSRSALQAVSLDPIHSPMPPLRHGTTVFPLHDSRTQSRLHSAQIHETTKEIRRGTVHLKKTNIRSRCRPLRLCFGSTMAKIDRIPDAWPALMTDVIAAAYLDFSVSQFRALVEARMLPNGRKVWGTTMVRWRRAQLDAAINLEFGLPANKTSCPSDETGDEWMDAIRAA